MKRKNHPVLLAAVSPNGLTAIRLLLAPALVLAVELEALGLPKWASGALFLFGAFTDFADGVLARRHSKISEFGTVMDPIADKLLVVTALFVLAAEGTLSGIGLGPAVVIIWRELLISGLREAFAGKPPLSQPLRLAKGKTAIQYAAVFVLLVSRDVPAFHSFAIVSLWLAAALSLYTLAVYLKRMGEAWTS